MRRRTLLKRTIPTISLVVPLAGCSGDGDSDDNGGDDGGDGSDSDGGDSAGDGEPPEAVFIVNSSRVPSDGTLEITYGSDDAFVAGQVTIEGENIASNAQGATWADLDDANGPNDSVENGDSIVIEGATAAYDVKLIWESSDGSTSEQILWERGPEA